MPIPDNEFLVNDFGAIGNGLTDDTPAFAAAIDAAMTAGGGVVSADPHLTGTTQKKTYLIRGGIIRDSGGTNERSLILDGKGSRILMDDNGVGNNFLTASNFGTLIFIRWVVVGQRTRSPVGSAPDCDIFIHVGSGQRFIVADNLFLGLRGRVAVLRSFSKDLVVRDNLFGGCGCDGSGPLVRFDTNELTFERNWCLDFGNLTPLQPAAEVALGSFYSKTPAGIGMWLHGGDTGISSGAGSGSRYRISHSRFDEGASTAAILFSAPPGGRRWLWIEIDSNTGLPSNVLGSSYVKIQAAEHVEIRGDQTGCRDATRTTYDLQDAGHVIFSHCHLEPIGAGAGKITADPLTRNLEIVETKYQQLQASTTGISTVTRDGLRAELLRADGAIIANTLVKQSFSTNNRVVQHVTANPNSLVYGVALEAAGGAGEDIRIVPVGSGQVAQIRSDGVEPIERGAAISRSTVTSGRIGISSGGTQLGRALESVSAVADVLIKVSLNSTAVPNS